MLYGWKTFKYTYEVNLIHYFNVEVTINYEDDQSGISKFIQLFKLVNCKFIALHFILILSSKVQSIINMDV